MLFCWHALVFKVSNNGWREEISFMQTNNIWKLRLFFRIIEALALILDKWDVALPGWQIVSPYPPRLASPLFFYRDFCYIIWVVWVDFCFCLRSSDAELSAFVHFPCILECCVSFLCFKVCLCVWGGVRRDCSTSLICNKRYEDFKAKSQVL